MKNKLPVLNETSYLADKNIDYRFYLASLLSSSFEGEKESAYFKFSSECYIYNIDYFLKKMKMNKSTFEKNTNKFLSSKVISLDENGSIKLRVKSDNLNRYLLVKEEEIKEMLRLSSNEIKVYIAIRSLKSISNNSKVYLSKIEMMTNLSTKTITKILEKLKEKGFINYKSQKSKTIKDLKLINTVIYDFEMIIFEKIENKTSDAQEN